MHGHLWRGPRAALGPAGLIAVPVRTVHRRGDDRDILGGCPPPEEAAPGRRDRRERCRQGHLARPPDKTRRLACGRGAVARRQRRGEGTPAPCDGRGCTPRCGQRTRGGVTGWRPTRAPRRRSTRRERQQPLSRRRHWPVQARGAWRTRGVTGSDPSSGVPRTRSRLRVVRDRRIHDWGHTWRRRSPRPRVPWPWRDRLAPPWRGIQRPAGGCRAPRRRVMPQGQTATVDPEEEYQSEHW